MPHRLTATLALLTWLACAGCSLALPLPTFGVEEPLGSGHWSTVYDRPAWVTRPTAEGGLHRFVTRARSNALPVAAPPGLPTLGEAFANQLAATLSVDLGDALASQCARAVAATAVPLARASKEELLSREPVVGNTMATAWTLWELDLEALLAEVADERRADARRILLATPLGGPVDDD